MTFSSFLHTSVTIQERTSTKDQLGQKIYSWSNKYTGVDARLIPISYEERVELGGEFDNVSYKALFPYSTDIVNDNRVVYDGDNYDVVEVITDTESNHKRVLLEKL